MTRDQAAERVRRVLAETVLSGDSSKVEPTSLLEPLGINEAGRNRIATALTSQLGITRDSGAVNCWKSIDDIINYVQVHSRNGESNGPSETSSALPAESICEELLDLANPNLYRNNLFRVLGIVASSSPAEMRQRQKRLEMQRKLGLPSDDTGSGFLSLVPPPSPEASVKALERMNDPVARFLDELFWFSGPSDDAGLIALGRERVTEARKLWIQSADRVVHAQHNLAVLNHLMALEHTADRDVNAAGACTAWKQLLATETFWDRARARVAEMNDARLTTGFVRRVRATLPRMILLIIARQAVAASEEGDAQTVSDLLKVIRGAGFDLESTEDAIRDALKPLRHRISAAVASARKHWTKTPQHGAKIVREMYGALLPLLNAHDRVAENEAAMQSVHDEVAEAMNQAEVAYCKATNDWAGGEKLLELAQGLAKGQRLRDQIAENIRVDQENKKSGNDWCAPGYWEVAPELLTELEKARAHAESGNFDAALDILLVLDKRSGAPLTRAIVYCLSVKGIRSSNAALAEFNAESGVLKEIMDKLPNQWRLPTPQTPTYMMPPCLACGSTFYTSWANLTWRGNKIFMCSSCSARHDRNLVEEKQVFARALEQPMDYLALAARLDPGDQGVARNRKTIVDMAGKNGARGSGDADALAKRLSVGRERRSLVAQVGAVADTCFFCGHNQGDKGSALYVPMHGPVKRVEFVLGRGVEYEYGDVIVPRCTQCREHHANWPTRVEKWHQTALSEADPKRHSKSVASVAKAKQDADKVGAELASANRAVEEAETALKSARSSRGFFASLLGRTTPACETARIALENARKHQSEATTRSHAAAEVHENALAELKARCDRAVAAYKAAHPQPTLPKGVRPEDDWSDAPVLSGMRSRSWEYGDVVEERGTTDIKVRGKVGRVPVLPERSILDVQPSGPLLESPSGGRLSDAAEVVEASAPPSWSTEQTCVLEVTSPGEIFLYKHTAGETYNYATIDNYRDVYINGQKCGSFDFVCNVYLHISPDGRHYCFQAGRNQKVIMQDGRSWSTPFDEIKYLAATEGVDSVFAIVKKSGKSRFVVNDKAGPEYDDVSWTFWVGTFQGEFRAYYSARKGQVWHLMLNGDCKEQAEAEIRGLLVSADRRIVRYWAMQGGKWIRKTNDKCDASCDKLLDTRQHGGYETAIVLRNQCAYIIADDGSETAIAGEVLDAWVHFGKDGRVSCVVQRSDGFHVIAGGREGSPIANVVKDSVCVSPDGNHYLCLAKGSDGRVTVVIDGKVSSHTYDECGEFCFSRNARHYAWRGQNKQASGVVYSACVDGKVITPSDRLAMGLGFHPKFAQTFAYVDYDFSAASGASETYVIDGQRLKAFRDILHYGGPGFQPDGSLSYFAVEGRKVYRVKHVCGANRTTAS